MADYTAYAIAKKPSGADIRRYEALGLVLANTITLLIEASSWNDALITPIPGDAVTWAREELTIRDVIALAPDGTPILYQVAACR